MAGPKKQGSKPQEKHRGGESRRDVWLPESSAPANDNEIGAFIRFCALISRHLGWLVPTLTLAGISFLLLWLQ